MWENNSISKAVKRLDDILMKIKEKINIKKHLLIIISDDIIK